MTPLNGSIQAELREDKVISTFIDPSLGPDIRPDLLYRLAGLLQTTLDIDQLIEIFFKNMQNAVAVEGISYVVPDRAIKFMVGRSTRHMATYNLTSLDEQLGKLMFFRSTRFREYELANIEGLLSTLLYPLRNALRYRDALDASYRDPLTGAGNRVAMKQTMEREVELAHRHELELSVLMLDLDHFKSINDTYGHSVGDSVLQQTVKAITHTVRQTDICFRFGGEEFLIVLSNTPKQDSLLVADRIRQAISDMAPKTPSGPIKITASVGCATLRPSDSRDQLLERADAALYKAKEEGRNSVVCDRKLPDCVRERAVIG